MILDIIWGGSYPEEDNYRAYTIAAIIVAVYIGLVTPSISLAL